MIGANERSIASLPLAILVTLALASSVIAADGAAPAFPSVLAKVGNLSVTTDEVIQRRSSELEAIRASEVRTLNDALAGLAGDMIVVQMLFESPGLVPGAADPQGEETRSTRDAALPAGALREMLVKRYFEGGPDRGLHEIATDQVPLYPGDATLAPELAKVGKRILKSKDVLTVSQPTLLALRARKQAVFGEELKLLVDERVLSYRAALENLTVEQLLDREVHSKLQKLDSKEVKAFEQSPEGQSIMQSIPKKSKAREAVAQRYKEKREADLKQQLMESARKTTPIEILLPTRS